MGRLVHTSLGSSYLIAHVLHCPPPPPHTALADAGSCAGAKGSPDDAHRLTNFVITNHLAGIASDHLSSSRPTARSLSQGMKTDKRCSGCRRRQGSSFTFARSPYPRARIPYASSNRRSLGFWTHSSQSPPKSSLSFRLTCPFAPRSPSARDSCVCVCMCVQTQLAVFKL